MTDFKQLQLDSQSPDLTDPKDPAAEGFDVELDNIIRRDKKLVIGKDQIVLSPDKGLSAFQMSLGVDQMTYAATISLDIQKPGMHIVSLTGNTTINATGKGLKGQFMMIKVLDDGTSRIVTFGTNFTSNGTFTTTINTNVTFLFQSDGTSWFEISRPAAAAAVTQQFVTSAFETAGRFTSTSTGVGSSVNFNTEGLQLVLPGGAIGSNNVTFNLGNDSYTMNIFDGNPTFTFSLTNVGLAGITGSIYFGIGQVTVDSTGHTFTTKHIGFKIVSGGAANISGTQADGTTEKATSLVVLSGNVRWDFKLTIISGTSVVYSYRSNNGAWTDSAAITGNMPTGAVVPRLQFSNSTNNATTGNYALNGHCFYYGL